MQTKADMIEFLTASGKVTVEGDETSAELHEAVRNVKAYLADR